MASAEQGYVPQSVDTDVVAERMQFEAYGTWSPAEKLQVVAQMCREARELSLAGLRLRHPSATADELELREAALRLGPELALAVYKQRFAELPR